MFEPFRCLRSRDVSVRRDPPARRPGGRWWCCLAALLAGCSGPDGRVPVYSVKGKVAFAGEAPVGALIVLHPIDGGGVKAPRPSAKVGADGSFSVTTYDAGDGAPAGAYTATIQWNRLVKKGQDYVAGPNVIPKAYEAPETSPWKITVATAPNELGAIEIKK